MLIQDYIPPPDVRGYVEMYRIIHLQFDSMQHVSPKAYPPRPEHCLAFYPFDTEKVKYQNSDLVIEDIPVVLYGQFTEVTQRTIGRNFLLFQIVFYPGALFRLTGIPAHEINNKYLDAREVLGKILNETNERLFYAKDYSSMIDVANDFMRRLMRKSGKPGSSLDDVFVHLLKSREPITINKLTGLCFYTIKQLERKFKERSGVNPKLYARIMRFDKAFRIRNAHPEFDWLRIAVECGFHDYQHLAKEYKDFTGMNPTAFHQLEENAPERALGLVEVYSNY